MYIVIGKWQTYTEKGNWLLILYDFFLIGRAIKVANFGWNLAIYDIPILKQ